MALNWGNEGNRDRIRNGYHLEDSQIEKEPAGVADEADDGSDEEQDEFNVDTASYRQLQKEATKRGIAANQSADILRAELT